MTDPEKPKLTGSLRGVLRGEKTDFPIHFAFGATLRIHGNSLPFEEISTRLGVQPTHVHRKGERRGPKSSPYQDDAWQFKVTLPETAPLAQHIETLWEVVKPHVQYLQSLKQQYKVDVFCGYRSNCDHAGIEVPHTCLEIFTALEVPFGLSIIIA